MRNLARSIAYALWPSQGVDPLNPNTFSHEHTTAPLTAAHRTQGLARLDSERGCTGQRRAYDGCS
jgi:hypothetical protein